MSFAIPCACGRPDASTAAHPCDPPAPDARAIHARHAAWSERAFGISAGPGGPLRHLAEEVAEALDSPDDVTEFADCLMLVFDAARRAGWSFDDLMWATWRKLLVNEAREWEKPAPGQPSHHVKG